MEALGGCFMPGQRATRILSQSIFILLLSIGALTMVGPFLWMFLATIKPAGEILAMPPKWLPSRLDLSAYTSVLKDVPIGLWYLNSIFVTAAVTISGVFTSTLAGFVFS